MTPVDSRRRGVEGVEFTRGRCSTRSGAHGGEAVTTAQFSDLLGKTVMVIDGKQGDETMVFRCSDGSSYQMHYYDDCCASCGIEDIAGELEDLIGSPIVRAEEPSSLDAFAAAKLNEYDDSFTWTFYILGTAKGTVTIRWYGSSNGYYSEAPTFEQVNEAAE